MTYIWNLLRRKFWCLGIKIKKIFGVQIGSSYLTVVILAAILSTNFITYIVFRSQDIHCKLSNFRTDYPKNGDQPPTIYIVTPTYARHVQKAELTRLSHTFLLVSNIHWIIIEDSEWLTDLVNNLVFRLKNEHKFLKITHLNAPTPNRFKLKPGEPSWKYPKGVWQRNKALNWIRENLINLDADGVIYFADDDNTYDLELFNEMRYTKKISVWPVGLAGGLLVERPIIKNNKVQSFNSMWRRDRPYPIDMAGFALSVRLFSRHLNASFSHEQKIGYIESHFLEQIIKSWDDLEPRADNCSKVLVWHTKTQNPALHEERKLLRPSHSDIQW